MYPIELNFLFLCLYDFPIYFGVKMSFLLVVVMNDSFIFSCTYLGKNESKKLHVSLQNYLENLTVHESPMSRKTKKSLPK